MYSTGNSTQYSVITYNGKESEKIMDICICITESLCCTPETQHCKPAIPQYKIKIKLKTITVHVYIEIMKIL